MITLVGAELEENLSLRSLAGAAHAAGIEARVLPLNTAADTAGLAALAAREQPDVVGISVPFQAREAELLGAAAALRSAGYRGHITVGGHFATFAHAEILRDHPAIDSVVRHEGEQTLVELHERLAAGTPLHAAPLVPGLVVRAPDGTALPGPLRSLPHLDTLADPARPAEPQSMLGVPAAPILGSRGCYADCSFCCIHAYHRNARGPRYRRRSVPHIAAEMVREYRERGVRLFVFHDDNFFLPRAEANIARYAELEALLQREGLTDIALVLKCRPNDADPELFRLLKRLGLVRVYVGIETNSDEGLISLNRRVSTEDNRAALALFDELGIYCTFNVLIFDPEATLAGVEANLDFLAEHTRHPFNFCRAEVYAGTPLLSALRDQGRLRGDYRSWTYAMREPRTELLFRIFVTAWDTRNFRADGVANLNMGIRFDSEILRHFAPKAWDAAWQDRLFALSEAIGADQVRRMREVLAFARQVPLDDHGVIKAYTRDTARSIARADLAFLAQIRALRAELEARIASTGRSPHGRYAVGGPLPWAAQTAQLSPPR